MIYSAATDTVTWLVFAGKNVNTALLQLKWLSLQNLYLKVKRKIRSSWKISNWCICHNFFTLINSLNCNKLFQATKTCRKRKLQGVWIVFEKLTFFHRRSWTMYCRQYLEIRSNKFFLWDFSCQTAKTFIFTGLAGH